MRKNEDFSKGLSIVKLLKTVEFTIKNVVVTEVTIRFCPQQRYSEAVLKRRKVCR